MKYFCHIHRARFKNNIGSKYMCHQAALDQLSYIITVLDLFEFFTAEFFRLLALNSKRS